MQWEEIPRENIQIPGERVTPGTPYFRYENVFNEPQSKIQGKPVYELKEVVEVRFPANPQYRPVFGVDEMCHQDDMGRVITWAERYATQYQAFLSGSNQESEGTPLEELLPFGITQAQLSLCRAMSIYSIEALHHLEGAAARKNAIIVNELKPMAKRWLEAKRDGSVLQSEVNELRRQLSQLQAGESVVADEPAVDPFATVSTSLPMSDEEKKAEIKRLTGVAPRGNPASATLDNLLQQARESATQEA